MSRLLKSLSSLVNGHSDRSPPGDVAADTAPPDAGPSTLTTPLFPLNGSDADAPNPPTPARSGQATAAARHAPSRGDAASAHALVPLATQPALHRATRKSASSRALNAVVRATTQVAVTSHVEPAPAPKVGRVGHHRSAVVLTETEKLRLQIMQVQIKLTALGLYDGAIDGMANPELIDGVRHFQTLKGMRDSGMLTTGTLTALGIRAID